MCPSQSQSPAHLLHLKRVIDEALAVVFDVTDEPGSLAMAAESAPMILDLVVKAAACLMKIQTHYEACIDDDVPTSVGATSLDDIGALISSEVAAQEVLDLAFIALAQLRLARNRLESAITGQNLLAIVTRADSALTRLRRECIPVEAAVADFENLDPPMRMWADLEASLEIRRVYGGLRRTISSVGDPTDADIADILAEFARRVASLGRDPIYPRLRISDRVQFQTLARRISTWLANESGRDLVTGGRIWSDLSTFCFLLIEVNKRQELVEHDRQVLARVYHTLYANVRPPNVISADILEALHSLEGLDEELDGHILHGTSRHPSDWEPAICRLYQSMMPSQPTGVSTGFI